MKPLHLLTLAAPILVVSAKADPEGVVFLPHAAGHFYVTPRVVVMYPRRSHTPRNSEALTDWKHTYAFFVQEPYPYGPRYMSTSYGDYWYNRWNALRMQHYREGQAATSPENQIVVSTKLVVSRFAASELPPVFLHNEAPTMPNALRNVPPPFTVTVR